MTWDNITLDKYLKLQKVLALAEQITEDELTKYSIMVLFDIDEDSFNNMNVKLFNEIVVKMEFLKSLPNYKRVKHYTIDDNVYTFTSVPKLKFGDYLSIKNFQFNSLNDDELLLSILAVLIKNEQKEFDINQINIVKKDLLKLPITLVLPIVEDLKEFEQKLLDNYDVLFNSSSDEGDLSDLNDSIIPKSFNNLALALRLANDDVTKLKEVYSMQVIEVYNVLTYWYYRDLTNKLNSSKK